MEDTVMRRFLTAAALCMLLFSCGKTGVDSPSAGDVGHAGLHFYDEPFDGIPKTDEIRMYEASPRCFAAEGSLQAIRSRLDHIKALNVNVIWIMPIFSGSETRRPYGSPYSMRDFYSIDPEYGTVDDLRQLVKDAHSKGMAVILDFVTKHTGSDCTWVKEHPGWYKDADVFSEPGFDPAGYTEAAEFDWNNRELRDEIIYLMKYWIAVTNIDGYRCDSASAVPDDFWIEAVDSLRNLQEGRDVILLAEAAQPVLLEDGFDMNYGWHFCDMLEKVFSGENPSVYTTEALFEVNEEEWSYDVMSEPGKTRLRFSTNHDRSAEASPLETYSSYEGSLAAFVLALTMGGAPMIYSSQEIAWPERLSFFKGNAAVMDWDSAPEAYGTYCRLMQIADSDVLRKGGTHPISNEDVMTFLRTYGDKEWLVAVNVRDRVSDFALPDGLLDADYTDLTTGTDFRFSTTSLDPYGYLILERKSTSAQP